MSRDHFGLYRGVCVNNVDPLALGRIEAVVPEVSGTTITGWALPCFPVGSALVPAVDEEVWITYEGGNVEYPVWLGTFGRRVAIDPG